MKKFSVGLLLLLFFSIFQITKAGEPESLIVIQKSLETKQLNRILQKDKKGNYLPIKLVSNGFLDRDAYLKREGQKIQIFEKSESTELKEEFTFLELTDLKIKKKKSVLKYDYGGKKVRIALKKLEGDWYYQSVYIKSGKGNYYLDISSID